MKQKNRKNLLHKGMDGYMRNLLAKLFGICMLSTTVSMIGQPAKGMNEVKNLRGVVKFGTAVKDVAECLEKNADNLRGELFAKTDKRELVHGGCLTFLKPELVREVRDALKVLNISDSFIKKMAILGITYCDDGKQKAAVRTWVAPHVYNKAQSFVPFAITVDTERVPQFPYFLKSNSLGGN